ncbi:Predicted nucleic acid-binding protein, contains PIN domain [Ruaniaceae bacterium KH17]|nr:Predicted nucleic acid-binding protein, contains PIN domain [Ruaniaceae bacterium KH17]
MIAYFDTSALVPLLLNEPSSEACRELWDAADSVATARIAYVEASAALAMAERLQRITKAEGDAALGLLDDLWTSIDVLELDQQHVEDSARSAREFALRAYDSVHFSAAKALEDGELVTVAGDGALLDAWRKAGLATCNVNA